MKSLFHKRLLGLALLVALVSVGFLYRLFDLQVRRGAEYFQLSQNHSLRRLRLAAPRGKILDRHGEVLAENRPSFALTLHGAEVRDTTRTVQTLAYLLDWPEERIKEQLQASGGLALQTPIVLAQDLAEDTVAKIRGKISRAQTEALAQWDLSGIALSLHYKRVYAAGMGNLLGYVREANAQDLQRWQKKSPDRLIAGERVGVQGVEKTFEDRLRGYPGFQTALVDALGRQVDAANLGIAEHLSKTPFVPGQDLQLTIDAPLTQVAVQAFGDQVGALVALDPRTGEILALVSQPSYDSQELSGVIPTKRWQELRDHEDHVLLNRPLQAAYPPGSTHKIVTAAAALAEGKVNFKEKIHCPGHYQHGGRKWGCWKRSGHGALNLQEALKYSCDVFFYKLGERLGPDPLAHYGALLGLGTKTGILVDMERAGLLPTAAWKQAKKNAPWKSSDNLGNAIGQGYNLVTPLQNALMVARFATGKRVQPNLVLGEDREVQEAIDWKLSATQWHGLREALVQVVQGVGGTGRAARVSEIQVAGKTGTAQVVGLSHQGGGRKTQDHAWFVAFAPAEDPKIAVAVVVEHGGSGGKVAAPIAQQVLNYHLKEQHVARNTKTFLSF